MHRIGKKLRDKNVRRLKNKINIRAKYHLSISPVKAKSILFTRNYKAST